jgi:glucose/arabinose dehydrogenase
MNTKYLYIFLLSCFMIAVLPSFDHMAQDNTSCGERRFVTDFPRVDTDLWCIEHFLDSSTLGELMYTSLEYGDHVLYATHPLLGQVVALHDTDDDGLVETETIIAEGLDLPNGLSFYNGSLYILANSTVYRYDARGLSIITENLSTGRGFIPRAILAYNERIYIGIPFPCNLCEVDENVYGVILSISLSGTNSRIIARGLRYPTAIEIFNSALWVTDISYDNAPSLSFMDEINQIPFGDSQIPHFGFPYCIDGLENLDFAGNFDCAQVESPSIILQTGSQPLSLSTYHSELFPWLNEKLLVTLGGSFDNSSIYGYAVVALDETEYEILVPVDHAIAGRWTGIVDEGISTSGGSEVVNRRGAGSWPHRIYDTAISSDGFIILSIGGQGLYALRPSPRTHSVCEEGYRDC